MLDWLKSHITEIGVFAGAFGVLFWPQIKKALAAAGSRKALAAAPSSPVGDFDCPICNPVSTHPHEKDRPDWVVVVMDLQKYCQRQRLSAGVDLCNKLCNELICGEVDKPSAVQAMAKATAGRKETR